MLSYLKSNQQVKNQSEYILDVKRNSSKKNYGIDK